MSVSRSFKALVALGAIGLLAQATPALAASDGPVTDEIGGTVIYLNGRPAYYVLNGEWFQAVESGEGLSGSDDRWVGESLMRDLPTNEIMSTS